jgi:ribosomal protein S18 acetylase RimI-like enzyme
MSGRVALRAPRRGDLRAMAAVCRASWRERYRGMVPGRVLGSDGVGSLARWMQGVLAAKGTFARLAIVAGKPVGVAVYRRKGGGRLELFQLFVAPRFQGIGAGRALIAAGLAEAARCGMRLELWVARDNVAAQLWYARRGGRPTGLTGGIPWNGWRLPVRLWRWPAGASPAMRIRAQSGAVARYVRNNAAARRFYDDWGTPASSGNG